MNSATTVYEPTGEQSAFIHSFEAGILPNTDFKHVDHVRLAWLYLRIYPTPEALALFSAGIKRFAAANGHADLYHETITWAFLFIINERIAEFGRDHSWKEFRLENEDLIENGRGVLERYYSGDVLHTDSARRVFLMPAREEPARQKGS